MNKTLITFITVVFNSKQTIEKTIKSILKFKNESIEYIIIDGGSTDGTVEIIKKFKFEINHFISEKDHGIYDAMNKGINLASGEWINFMNSGDILLNIPKPNDFNPDLSFVYGKAKIFPNKILNVKKKIDFKDFSRGMIICHQAVFYNLKKLKTIRYDINYKFCADQKATFLILNKGNGKFIDKIIVEYDTTGISSIFHLSMLFEKVRLNRELGLSMFHPFISFFFTKLVILRDSFKSKVNFN